MSASYSLIPDPTGETFEQFKARKDREALAAFLPPRDLKAEALVRMLGWVEHWQEDARCNLKSTEASLASAREMLRTALGK